eukprot:CAMPEP_0168532916 /NCGR_PEP_ID=MMETSP0405-20121227/16671_1 /TAXON_ID=498012 /ORGANISM="Trichosphaerium sp, Strain Am-I-7 wt" /LENGTH=172 /DNA_ID=CAMNT_0008558687 /DNA_START=347 /DNA_END=865 /DNA_ORIENTATION=-
MKVDLNKLLDRAEDYTLAGELQEGNTTRVVSNVRQAALPRIPRCSLKTHKQQTTAAIQQMKMNINELVRLQVCHQTNPGIHASYEANEAFIHQRVGDLFSAFIASETSSLVDNPPLPSDPPTLSSNNDKPSYSSPRLQGVIKKPKTRQKLQGPAVNLYRDYLASTLYLDAFW